MDSKFGNALSRAQELFHRIETQGAAYVATLVDAQKSEELFLDYKKISTKVSDRALSNHDRDNFKKALSGFANSEGGVILWGLDTEKVDGVESLKSPEGYPDVTRFVSLLEDAVSGCTVPPVPGVRSIAVPLGEGSTKGFVATLIPVSLIAPHQTSDDSRAYYMRAGSSFKHVPHGVLAGMFGRRPSPEVSIHQLVTEAYSAFVHGHRKILIALRLELSNASSVVARNAYVSWQARELGSRKSELIAQFVTVGSKWDFTKADARTGSVLAEEGNRLAPYSRTPVVNLRFVIMGEIEEGLDVDIYFGCESAPPRLQNIFISGVELQKCIYELGENSGVDSGTLQVNKKIGSRILGISSAG